MKWNHYFEEILHLLVHNRQTWKLYKCPLMDKWIKAIWYMYNGILLNHLFLHLNEYVLTLYKVLTYIQKCQGSLTGKNGGWIWSQWKREAWFTSNLNYDYGIRYGHRCAAIHEEWQFYFPCSAFWESKIYISGSQIHCCYNIKRIQEKKWQILLIINYCNWTNKKTGSLLYMLL